MSRYSSDSGNTEFKQPPAGNHLARAVELIDLGTQHGEYQGEPNVRQQVLVRWELPLETIEVDGVEKPMLVSKFYTNSLGEKANLRKDLESWRSRPFTAEELKKFDLMTILGKACMVSIILNDKGKARVTSVGAVPKGMTCPLAFNELKSFWLDEWDAAKFEALPEGFKRIIMESDEFKELMNPHKKTTPAELPDDDFRSGDMDPADDPPF